MYGHFCVFANVFFCVCHVHKSRHSDAHFPFALVTPRWHTYAHDSELLIVVGRSQQGDKPDCTIKTKHISAHVWMRHVISPAHVHTHESHSGIRMHHVCVVRKQTNIKLGHVYHSMYAFRPWFSCLVYASFRMHNTFDLSYVNCETSPRSREQCANFIRARKIASPLCAYRFHISSLGGSSAKGIHWRVTLYKDVSVPAWIL